MLCFCSLDQTYSKLCGLVMNELEPSTMNTEQLKSLLAQAFPDADIAVTGEAGKFDLRIVDTGFEGKRTVARQQAVYAPINEHIASGAVHAVTIRAMTPEEWRKVSMFGA